MAAFVPKAFRVKQSYPACVDLDVLFSDARFAATLERVVVYLHGIYEKCSDNSRERTSRPGVITEVFYACMPTVDAYTAEIELCNAIWEYSLGELLSEKIKVYLKKYLETHIFVYREVEKDKWTQEFKTGYSRRTGREIPLWYLDFLGTDKAFVVNDIQRRLLPLLEVRSGNNAEYRICTL